MNGHYFGFHVNNVNELSYEQTTLCDQTPLVGQLFNCTGRPHFTSLASILPTKLLPIFLCKKTLYIEKVGYVEFFTNTPLFIGPRQSSISVYIQRLLEPNFEDWLYCNSPFLLEPLRCLTHQGQILLKFLPRSHLCHSPNLTLCRRLNHIQYLAAGKTW